MKNLKKNQPTKIIFIVDSIEIGGIQRLCFDECYELIDRKIDHEILCLTNKVLPEGTILKIDENYSKINKINLTFLGINRFQQILNMKKVLKLDGENTVQIISHSTRGTFIARMSAVLSLKNLHITLFIHQLLNLSDSKQKLKRIFHSFFASEITTSSIQFKFAWEDFIKSHILLKMLYRKNIKFNRMGVYLPRLRNSSKTNVLECSQKSLHLLFMSRITAWKGYPVFNNVCKLMEPQETHSIVISNENSRKNIFDKNQYVSEKNHYLSNTGIANLDFRFDIIHIYPTNYGPGIKYPQSIGMNVIECLGLGIPSLISYDDYETWPEFRESPLVRIVDWQDKEDTLRILQELIDLPSTTKKDHTLLLEEVIDIKKHVNLILR
jgi:hypothetical protein